MDHLCRCITSACSACRDKVVSCAVVVGNAHVRILQTRTRCLVAPCNRRMLPVRVRVSAIRKRVSERGREANREPVADLELPMQLASF
jgi:hypothetical protein